MKMSMPGQPFSEPPIGRQNPLSPPPLPALEPRSRGPFFIALIFMVAALAWLVWGKVPSIGVRGELDDLRARVEKLEKAK